MLRRTIAVAVFLFCFGPVSHASIRAPGTYHGVVIFDRWDTCYLYSGIYVMYVSEKIKEQIRPFAGRPVIIEAQQVFQPMNPGDGLIQKIGSVEPDFPSPDAHTPVIGVELRVKPAFIEGHVRFMLEVSNTSGEPIGLSHTELAVTMFKKKHEHEQDDMGPSDGISAAALTRFAVWNLSSHGIRESQSVIIKPSDIHNVVILSPGTKETLEVEAKLGAGEYELLAGYGGGVHESVPAISNRISFDVSSNGLAQVRP